MNETRKVIIFLAVAWALIVVYAAMVEGSEGRLIIAAARQDAYAVGRSVTPGIEIECMHYAQWIILDPHYARGMISVHRDILAEKDRRLREGKIIIKYIEFIQKYHRYLRENCGQFLRKKDAGN